MLHVQETGVVTNAEVQKLGNVSKATATRYLSELEDEYLEKMGTTGVGTQYKLKGLITVSYFQDTDKKY
ncbi:hypothetical protein [Algoriphagus aquimarinus]|uniref:hypothetical protein n=1 Tax=Algoriphagus aquimarinus TaxID=237018 RepID=UPI0030DA3224